MSAKEDLDRLPDFLVIGAQRGGSTLLHRILREHPGVFMPKGETLYFDDPYYQAREPRYLARSVAGAAAHQKCGIRRPEILARPECASRVARELPRAKLVAALREPISRTVSAYSLLVMTNNFPVLPVNDGLRMILENEVDGWPHARLVLEYSRYGAQLQRLLEYFDRAALFVVPDEELFARPSETSRRLYEFIGVDDRFRPTAAERRVNGGVYSLHRLRWLRCGTRIAYRRNGSDMPILRENPGVSAATKLVNFVDRVALSRIVPNRKPVLERNLTAELGSYFRPDLEFAEQLLGRRLPTWREAMLVS